MEFLKIILVCSETYSTNTSFGVDSVKANVANRCRVFSYGIKCVVCWHSGHVRDSAGRDEKRHILEVLDN